MNPKKLSFSGNFCEKNEKNRKITDNCMNFHIKTVNIIRLNGDTSEDFSITNEEEI